MSDPKLSTLTDEQIQQYRLLFPERVIAELEAEIERLRKMFEELVEEHKLEVADNKRLRDEVALWKERTTMGAEIIMGNVAEVDRLKLDVMYWRALAIDLANGVEQLRAALKEISKLGDIGGSDEASRIARYALDPNLIAKLD